MTGRVRNLLLVGLLAGCTLAPAYKQPLIPVANTYPSGPAYRLPDGRPQVVDPPVIVEWQSFFTDPRLRAIIALALRENRDLRVAVANVEQAQARFRLQRSDLFPHISLSGAAEYEGLPQNGLLGSSLGSTGGGTTSTATATTGANGVAAGGSQSVGATEVSGFSGSGGGTFRFYSAGIGFSSYELDVFGRLRSLTRSAFEQYLAQDANARSVRITLIAQVADAYLAILADDALLAVTRDTLAAQQRTYDLTKALLDAGSGNALTVRQTETQVDQARANLALYTRQQAQDMNALVLLVGAPLPANLPPASPIGSQTVMADLPAGLPSDVLANRPDIIQAEHTLRSDDAQIGAARAAFFPQISLTAQDGLESLQFRKLFTAAATTWSFAPQITVPIFTFGQNQASLDIAKLEQRADVAAYEKAIQTAFREVSDALTARATYLDQVREQQALVAASADAYHLAQLRFQAGVDSYLTTLDSQRTLYAAQQSLLQAQALQLQNLVTLYRALGGGWRAPQFNPKPPPAPFSPF